MPSVKTLYSNHNTNCRAMEYVKQKIYKNLTDRKTAFPVFAGKGGRLWLQDNTDQPVAAFVDDTFERFLQLHAGIGGHMVQLAAKPLVDKLV